MGTFRNCQNRKTSKELQLQSTLANEKFNKLELPSIEKTPERNRMLKETFFYDLRETQN